MIDYLNLYNFLKPIYKSKLIRLGSENDGGYLINENVIGKVDNLVSLGIEYNWDFEKDMYYKSNCKIHAYEKLSYSFLFWSLFTIRQIIQFIFNPNFKSIKKIFLFIDFIFFFRNKKIKLNNNTIIHPLNKHISNFNSNQKDLNFIFKTLKLNNVVLKIDIEGSEYRIFDQIIKNQNNILSLIIEIHDIDLHKTKIKEFIDKLELKLIHIHVNDDGWLNEDNFAPIVECTFTREEFAEMRKDSEFTFPIDLDKPNNHKMTKDRKIVFY